ncbi:MAG: DUF1810 domain-containing protein [Actinomycetia bacterium]|nr:DUF1810 domain-containing protein [Actinomycetes bacterium]
MVYDLGRFVEAQAGSYDAALAEIRAGAKRTHWMWYVFPQLAGLGSSPMARRYALSGADEAQAYLDHPVLGPRLVAITAALLHVPTPDPSRIFGYPDDLKCRSCLTLFAALPRTDPVFAAALHRLYGGVPDPATLRLLGVDAP